MTFSIASLSAPFPASAIHWRAQTLTKDGDKALALAYLDARDVQDRLDAVCGPENWQDSYTETVKGRLICTLAIRINNEWISKSDGAGDTDVEGDKGAISDALKRAAVKWGVGRYLYRLDNVWAPCELGQNGKWRKWKPEAARVFEAALAKIAPAAIIDDAQYAELTTLSAAVNADTTAMLGHYQVAALNQLTVPQWEDAMVRLRQRLPTKKAA